MNVSASAVVAIVIPARFNSSRLPGKPLADIGGKPMVQHVYERALQVPGVQHVVVATDDSRVMQAVSDFNGDALMTSAQHPSGTDRLAEVMQQLPADIYINIQGDEPLVRPEDIALLVDGMRADSSVQIGTLCHSVSNLEAQNSNCVKVVLANNGDALYFSRSAIPFQRDAEDTASYLKHVGVYGYRREILQAYSQLPQPMIEQSEKLEQLRLLAAGFKIRAFTVEPTGPGVDTPECLERVRAIMSGQPIETVEHPLARVKLVITDVDGVLTDGGIYYDASGECLKRFHVRDGLGIRMLEESGVKVAVLSGRDSATLRKRIADLGITLFQLGVKDKEVACRQLMEQVSVTSAETAFVGDDSIDLPAFSVCGFAVAVADAPRYVQAEAKMVLDLAGGQGAFREFSDKLLAAKKKSGIYDNAEGFLQGMNAIAQ
jgi:3-deoxy-D-manno-octulosonate 8-phosphate phosphatase (KDO 8-P phosphatase)